MTTEYPFLFTNSPIACETSPILLPALASGLSQRDLCNLKELENDVLKSGEKLIPLTSSYTQSASGSPGAPKKPAQEKAPKTVQNEDSLDKGGSK